MIEVIMLTLISLHARQILDSRGNPTVECDAQLSDGSKGRASVPSGASTGMHEAVERRDGGSRFSGKSVYGAVDTISQTILPLLATVDPFDQSTVDKTMIQADGTENKSLFGANAILAVSLAIAKACAQSSGIPFYQYVSSLAGNSSKESLPMPMINIINGGQHANFATDIQEYMIVPIGAKTFDEALEWSANVFHALASLLKKDGHAVTVGDEGGYAPHLSGGNSAPLEYIVRAIEECGYTPGVDVSIALDVAASEFYSDGKYALRTEKRELDASAMTQYLTQLIERFPIVSIEDGLDENDWENWRLMAEGIGQKFYSLETICWSRM